MEVIVTVVSKLVYNNFITYLGDLQPTNIGVLIDLLSTMDITVWEITALVRFPKISTNRVSSYSPFSWNVLPPLP